MTELINYLKDEYGIATPGEVRWSHAVNSKEKLGRFLNNPDVMMIESDIRISGNGTPVCVHPPETESDLSFDALIDQMKNSRQGLKLDFKDPEILITCLQKLRSVSLSQPVLLNADILQGNGANPSKFSSVGFLARCREDYPTGILSLGWTTVADSVLGYTKQNIDEMLQLCKGLEQVTFPVRACLLQTSWTELTRLIENDGYTLAIWNNEPVSEELQKWIKDTTDPRKTFYDFIDENKDPLRFW